MSNESQEATAQSSEPTHKWFTMNVEEVADTLDTSTENGLSGAEAKDRIDKYGYNELQAEEKRPRWKVFLDQFKDVLIYILIASAAISAAIESIESGEPGIDWLVITVIIILNAIIGFVQEGKADEAIEKLRNISAPDAQVVRDGKEVTIKAKEIVPGDVIILHEGDKIPADGRLFEESNFKAQEAALTGESVATKKKVEVIEDEECPLGDRKNMVFSSTLATYGRGRAIATETGMKTEVGKIATMISEAEEKMTPLQRNLEEFGAWLGKIILVVCALVSIIYIVRAEPITDSIIAGVALAVAAIPEGLPAVVTVCLAIGVTRMSEKNAIIKKLHSVETLGCTTVICSDKTGTLTKNEMTVRSMWAGDQIYEVTGAGYNPEGDFLVDGEKVNVLKKPDAEMTLRIGLLCNNARLGEEDKWICYGDPTEGCLITSAWKAGIEREEAQENYPRIDEIPFDSSRKRMSTIHEVDGKEVAYIKGATEILLDLCANIQENGEVRPITEEDKKKILDVYESKAKQALRGLGFAYREVDGVEHEIEKLEKDMTFVGMQFMIDPPREEVKDAIEECKGAGIGVKMVTGDNLITATAIAEELGIISAGEVTHEGKDMPNMTDDKIAKCNVFARVSPEHKQVIVKALQSQNEVVAMTGDGVNDAPALKNADVGVAMGITGTDVSKEAAVMVLADDNFATIVNAVEEGRGIYDNIKKFVQYLLSSNVMEVLVLFFAAVIGQKPPLVATQLLWINLVTDGAPAVALGFDPYDPTLMDQKPRPPNEPILTKNFLITMIYRGVIMTILVLGIYELYYVDGPFAVDTIPTVGPLGSDHTQFTEGRFHIDGLDGPGAALETYNIWRARSVTFLVMMFGEMANAYNCRSEYTSIFTIGFFTNKTMTYSVLTSALLTVLLYFWKPLGNIFYVVPLTYKEWLWLIPFVIMVIGSVELLKLYFRKQLDL